MFLVSAPATGESPYPPSPVIEGITWHWETHSYRARGSDIWPVTWADDDNLYTSWGDGGGFGGSNDVGRVSLGFGRIVGPPEDFVGVNVWGGKNAQNPATFGGKCSDMLSVDGVLYAWINIQNGNPPDFRLAWSTDHSATWTLSSFHFSSATFAPGSFLSLGKDYAGAFDDFVYFYGGAWGREPKSVYMGRVPKNLIRDVSAYTYLTHVDGEREPAWSPRIDDGKPVFTDVNSSELNVAFKFRVIFNPGVDRYMMTTFHGGPGRLGVFDAPKPWGPWTTIAYYDSWNGYGTRGEGLGVTFPAKWMSADGLTLPSVFSLYGEDAGDAHDRFNLVRARLTLKPDPVDTIPPKPPRNVSVR